jgi:hypothetical protein
MGIIRAMMNSAIPPSFIIDLERKVDFYQEFHFKTFFNDQSLTKSAAIHCHREHVKRYEKTNLLEFDRPQNERWGYFVAGYPTEQYYDARRHAELGIYWNSDLAEPNFKETITQVELRFRHSLVNQADITRYSIYSDQWVEMYPNDTTVREFRKKLKTVERYCNMNIPWDNENNVPNIPIAVRDAREILNRRTISIKLHSRIIERIAVWENEFPENCSIRDLVTDFNLLPLRYEIFDDEYVRISEDA